MQIGYGIILEGETYNFMREMELLLFDKFNLKKGLFQPPHITIKPPFEVDNLLPYQNYLDELCQKIAPFYIHLKGFNCFSDKVIYLDVQQNQSLYDLYNTIFTDINSKYNHEPTDEKIIFHATLAYEDIDKDTFSKAYEYLKANHQPEFKFLINKIGLFYKIPDDSEWIIIKEKTLNV